MVKGEIVWKCECGAIINFMSIEQEEEVLQIGRPYKRLRLKTVPDCCPSCGKEIDTMHLDLSSLDKLRGVRV